MPHSLNKIWASNGSGISITGDIKEVLDSKFNDIGNLCRSNNIAKWAKYKPVDLPFLSELTDEQRLSVNCGMVAPNEAGSAATAVNNPEDAAEMAWEYRRPTTVYRVLDFNGYRHDAVYPPIVAKDSEYNKVFGGGVGLFSNPYAIGGNDGAIQYSDIDAYITRGGSRPALALGDWYMAVLLKVGSNKYVKTSSMPLSTATMVSLTSNDIETMDPQGNVDFIEFNIILCDTQMDLTLYNRSDPNVMFYPALCDDVSQMHGIVTLNSSSGLTASVISIVGNNSIPGSWPPEAVVDQFVGPPSSISPDGTDPNRYLSISSSYTLALKISIHNQHDTERNITAGGIKCSLSSNFAGYSPEADIEGIYDVNGNEYGDGDKIKVPGSGSVDVIILLPDDFYRFDNMLLPQNVDSGQKIHPTLSLTYYYGDLVKLVIKVSN